MSALVIPNIKKIIMYIGLYFLSIICLYVGTLFIEFVFNLGTHFGTFMRCIYAFICN